MHTLSAVEEKIIIQKIHGVMNEDIDGQSAPTFA